MARDNYYCFMCGRYETDWFFRQPESKLDGMDCNDCDVVPIIKREVLAQNEDPSEGITGAGEVCQSFHSCPWRCTSQRIPSRLTRIRT